MGELITTFTVLSVFGLGFGIAYGIRWGFYLSKMRKIKGEIKSESEVITHLSRQMAEEIPIESVCIGLGLFICVVAVIYYLTRSKPEPRRVHELEAIVVVPSL